MGSRLTSKPWFGPRKYLGWGWRITSWEGLLATAIFGVVLVACIVIWPSWRVAAVVVLVILYTLLAFLTGDPPGGPTRQTDSGTQ